MSDLKEARGAHLSDLRRGLHPCRRDNVTTIRISMTSLQSADKSSGN